MTSAANIDDSRIVWARLKTISSRAILICAQQRTSKDMGIGHGPLDFWRARVIRLPRSREPHQKGIVMPVTIDLTPIQVQMGERIDGLDLEPVVFKLTHPEPGGTGMTLVEADQLIAAYRGFLKLCAWYPDLSFVPSKAVDQVWHAHILDTAKYADDTRAVFGRVLDHFPYLGMRGADDEAAWQDAFARTRDMFQRHFGCGLPGGQAMQSCSSSCQIGKCAGTQCSQSGCHSGVRPRPDRS
jgi:hypothetical protein